MKANDILTREEISTLVKPSDLQGVLAVCTTWGMIAASFALVAVYPSPVTVIIALVILGGRHLALAILMHDASHYSLFKTRKLNDWIGLWLCAYPIWQDLKRYRVHHLDHHRLSGSLDDPDISLIRGFPVTRASLLRKFLRDLSGLTALRRMAALALIDLGFAEYNVAAESKPIPQRGRTIKDIFAKACVNMHGVFLTNLLFFGVLKATGHPWLYGLWVASYMTTFSVFVRIRSMAEHACTEMNLDPFKSTRTITASPLARVTVAPHRVNYHLEHHLLMTAPAFNLPKIRRLLKERGALAQAHTARNYGEILKTVTGKGR